MNDAPAETQASVLTPAEEHRYRLGIRQAGILVSDVRRKEFDESLRGIPALRRDDSRDVFNPQYF